LTSINGNLVLRDVAATTGLSLELKGIAKVYGGRTIFDGISVALEAGRSLAVAGRNGSGKSTLLKIVCGLVRPTRGEIVLTVAGRAIPAAGRYRYIGLVAPDLVLYDELTALENLQFFARVRGLEVSEGHLRERLGEVGLERRAHHLNVGSFSSGMKQRLKYAFALLHRPGVLLLDEPTSNLDEAGIAMVEQVVALQREQGILIVAANDAEELRYGDSILRLGQAVGSRSQERL